MGILLHGIRKERLSEPLSPLMTPTPRQQKPAMKPQIDRVTDPSIRTLADLDGIVF